MSRSSSAAQSGSYDRSKYGLSQVTSGAKFGSSTPPRRPWSLIQRASATASSRSLTKIWPIPARRSGHSATKSTSHRLWARMPARRCRYSSPSRGGGAKSTKLGKNGGIVFGKSTSATTPSDSMSDHLRSESQLRTRSLVSLRSRKGFLYFPRQASKSSRNSLSRYSRYWAWLPPAWLSAVIERVVVRKTHRRDPSSWTVCHWSKASALHILSKQRPAGSTPPAARASRRSRRPERFRTRNGVALDRVWSGSPEPRRARRSRPHHDRHHDRKGEAMEIEPKKPSVKGPAELFTGDVWIDPVVVGQAPSRVRVNAVHFTPGARTAWHSHALGQTLYVMEVQDSCGLAEATSSASAPVMSSRHRRTSGAGTAQHLTTS